MRKLYKYQQAIVDRASESTALFWDMGLGKTLTSLYVFDKFYKQDKVNRLFVICPVSMVDEWISEYNKEFAVDDERRGAESYKELAKMSKKLNMTFEEYMTYLGVDCVVLNYDMVWRIPYYEWVNDKTMIICDESHKIKNAGTRVGKYMKFLKIKTKYKMCLTGTPQSQGFIDYYNQLYFLDIINMSFASFKDRYCIYEDKAFNGIKIKQLAGYKNVGELERLYLDKCEFLKIDRVYDEIIKYNQVKLPVTTTYERVKKDRVIFYDVDDNIVTNRKEIDKYYNGDASSIVTAYKYLDNAGSYRYGLRSLLDNEHKHQWLKDFFEGYDKRVTIFYNYNHELDSIIKICDKLGRPYSIYNGGQKDFTNFKEHENGVAICNYKSGSFGINDLVISNVFIAYSPTDNYLEWEQSKKRINRNGQKNTPIYYFLECGLESRIYHSLKLGQNFDDRVFIAELEENLI